MTNEFPPPPSASELAEALRTTLESGQVPEWLMPQLRDVLACLERIAASDAKRAEGGRAARAAESERIDAGIRMAIGAPPTPPPQKRGTASVVQRRIRRRGPEYFGLSRVPDLRTIQRTMTNISIANAHTSSRWSGAPGVTSSSSSTSSSTH